MKVQPSATSRTLTMFLNTAVFRFVAHSSEVSVGLQHHIVKEAFLGWIQEAQSF